MEQLYTIEEIRAKVRSGQYGAELMLRHLLALYDGKVRNNQTQHNMDAPKSDTPETDKEMQAVWLRSDDSCCETWAEKYGDTIDVVDADFARTLERDRDQARADAVRLADRLCALEQAVVDLEQERDRSWLRVIGLERTINEIQDKRLG